MEPGPGGEPQGSSHSHPILPQCVGMAMTTDGVLGVYYFTYFWRGNLITQVQVDFRVVSGLDSGHTRPHKVAGLPHHSFLNHYNFIPRL